MNRANRAIWEIVRGLYTLRIDRVLPELSFLNIEIFPVQRLTGYFRVIHSFNSF